MHKDISYPLEFLQISSYFYLVLIDVSCEKCPQGNCDREPDHNLRRPGNCKIYFNGYHCQLGDKGVPCDYGSDCFTFNGKQYFTWIGSSANLENDKCYHKGQYVLIPNT